MNTIDEPSPRLPWTDRAWLADWRDFATLHFALPPDSLASHIPYKLDLHDGRAWVSLVWFNLERLRFAHLGLVGRWLCRPLSNHPFLNVRTYVQGEAGPGICFIAEWISNRLNVLLGPATYRLPYRYGRFTTITHASNGTRALRIEHPGSTTPLTLLVPQRYGAGERCPHGSVDAFLLERYQAYNFDGTGGSRFRVAHAPWTARRADWVRYDLGFLRTLFPWFAAAEFHSAHLCDDQIDVEMSRPHYVSTGHGDRAPANDAITRETPAAFPYHA